MIKFNLGDKVKDTISGFEGVAIERVTHINGCVEYAVVSDKLHEEKVNTSWFFDNRLEVVEPKPVPRTRKKS